MTIARRIAIPTAGLLTLLAFTGPPAAAETAAETMPARIEPGQLIDPDAEFPAIRGRWNFSFPRDHAAHDAYRTEAWLFTGVLETDDEELLGLQLTMLRLALAPALPDRGSNWRSAQVFTALLGISSPGSEGLLARQRTTRAALGLAGTEADPLRLWVENWQVTGIAAAAELQQLELDLQDDDFALALGLSARGPLSDSNTTAGTDAGNTLPFVYYVQPFLEASGSLDTGGGSVAVTGRFALEHAWGELPLPGGAVDRDRFTLFMRDGRVIQLLRTTGLDASVPASVQGAILAPGAATVPLSGDDVILEPTRRWASERSGRSYPIEWSVTLAGQAMELLLTAAHADAAGTLVTPLWAGPVRIAAADGTPAGVGLVQLTGTGEK